MAEKKNSSDSDGLIIDDNIIRIQLKKTTHKKWELRTRNLSPGIKFPTIQLFDAEGNLLVETNDENVSIKSLECNDSIIKSSQSLREKNYKHIIRKKYIRKHNTISGDKFYTRVYNNRVEIKNNNNYNEYHIIKDSCIVTNRPSKLTINNNLHNLQVNSLDTTPFHSEVPSKASSYKSSDNETYQDLLFNNKLSECKSGTFDNDNCSSRYSVSTSSISLEELNECNNDKFERQDNVNLGLQTSQSFDATRMKEHQKSFYNIQRSTSNAIYNTPQNKVSFLNTYLKSLPVRANPNPDWFTAHLRQTTSTNNSWKTKRIQSDTFYSEKNKTKYCELEDNTTEKDFMSISTDVAAGWEMKKRLRMYRRGISEIESRCVTSCLFKHTFRKRRHSVSGAVGPIPASSSSESVDEADVVLYRLKRRILKNKLREKRRSFEPKPSLDQHVCKDNESEFQDDWRNAGGGAFVRSRLTMGSNISQHSAKGLKGRRARSSGDLCNGETKNQTESSVCGSVVGEVMGWNRSLPNHLDGNRHLADYSRVNNNYGDFGTYRSHPKGGRGLRYRISKSGSNAEPVWKLQDQGFDQGYGSERSPEEDFIPPILPPISIEQYEAELRTVYPFITDENTFTVVVEKDGRGLGMSVCGGGLVRIRRLYPPQPAWRTGRLAPKDLLLSANGVPLAGLSTYEALEVLRTASARVELRVCRAPTDLMESVTPPDPPTPPARTPHPQHLPLDPLNCHPLHARLSQTTSSATSSSEGRGRRDASPEAGRLVQDLDLPELDQHLPVYDIQYGEFDIVMTKVNGSLGFTLRKEDHSALGHYVRALVREPALSDGRVQPGDRIVAVNDTAMSSMSHAEAVAFLRACGSEVRLRLYRDHAATPLSPMSPKEDGHTDSDAPLNKPKPPLRAEAVSMLCDLAARRLAPDATATSPAPSPRRARKLTKDHHCERTHDVSSFATLETHTKRESFKRSETGECSSFATEQCTIDRRVTLGRSASASNTEMLTVHNNTRFEEPKRRIPLASPTAPLNCRKQKLSLTVPPHGYELNNLDNDQLDAPNLYQENITLQRFAEPAFPIDSDEPVSMPTELSSDERFKHSCPAYQSAVLHTITTESTSDGHKDDGNGFKKWKAATPLPNSDRKTVPHSNEAPAKPKETKEIEIVQKENVKPGPQVDAASKEPTIVTVELNRGWNSRLGFSVRSHPDSAQSYISAVHGDSAAARDGRLRTGDVILQVNDENVTSMKTPEVIDLLRLLRGSICITVLRPASV